MAYFSEQTLTEIDVVASAHGIEPATLRAVAEVESGGRAFAYVGGRKEPLIRFEGHYFHRLLDGAERDRAQQQGLASPRAGAIKNPRKQADRWALIERAAKIDRQAALQSVSWGIGQVMGVHWKTLGYGSVDALVREARSGVAGQIRLMLRFISVNRLVSVLHARDWAGFARRYNGPAYAKNRYDVRLAAAYARHRDTKPTPRSVPYSSQASALVKRGSRGEHVRDLQRMLTAVGFPLQADGVFGARTEASLRAFQRLNGLVVDGIHGPRTVAALKKALPRLTPSMGWLRILWHRISRLFAR